MLLLVNIRKNLLWENKNRNYIMALVRSPINKASELRTKENKLRNKVPTVDHPKPVIDYGKLKELCNIDGLQSRDVSESSGDAHKKFMDSYQSVFVKPEAMKGIPIHSETRSKKHASVLSKSVGGNTLTALADEPKKTYPVDELTHDIRDYLPLLHKSRNHNKAETVKADKIKVLRKILRKLPFERNAEDNAQIQSCLEMVPKLTTQVSPAVLKELCVVAHLDVWKDDSVTIFGNSGWHFILKGTVGAMSPIWHKKLGDSIELPSSSPKVEYQEDLKQLTVGDCFGTFEPIQGMEASSKVLAVQTLEAGCEFLTITCTNYNKVIDQIKQHDEKEKVVILQSCKTFKLWSQQSLAKVASLVEWESFPANTVLVSEGYKAPFAGIIKSGECHVLRRVNVIQTLKDGRKETQSREVEMGKLKESESFGEISVVTNEPITCSIVTASDVVLGCIEQEKLQELDEVTLQLLQQSGEPTFGDLTEEDIHEEYIKQEKQRQWMEFKHEVIIDVINSRGIRPGYGKWSQK